MTIRPCGYNATFDHGTYREKSPIRFLVTYESYETCPWHTSRLCGVPAPVSSVLIRLFSKSRAMSACWRFCGVQRMGLTESGRILLGKNKHTSYSSQKKMKNLLRCHKVINPTFMDYAHIHPREPAVLYRVSPTWKGLRTSKKKRAMGINRYSWIDDHSDHSPIWASCPSFWPWRVWMHLESWKLFGQQRIGQNVVILSGPLELARLWGIQLGAWGF